MSDRPASHPEEPASRTAASATSQQGEPDRTKGHSAWILPGIAIIVLVVGVAWFTARVNRRSTDGTTASAESHGQTASMAVEGEVSSDSRFVKTEAQWREQLTEDQYYVLRQAGTERPFSNAYHDNKATGTYLCAGCGNELYSSETKFDSGTGWPSFYAPIAEGAVLETPEESIFDTRTEVTCSRCAGHLGHVFDDGPQPTGLRYCMNSVAMTFVPTSEAAKSAKREAKE